VSAAPLWERRDDEREAAVLALFQHDVTRHQYLKGATDPSRISPDTWSLDQYYLNRPGNDRIQLTAAIRPSMGGGSGTSGEHKPPTLIVWRRNDPFSPSPERKRIFATFQPPSCISLTADILYSKSTGPKSSHKSTPS